MKKAREEIREEDLIPIRVEDFDEEVLMQLAREGRLYIAVDDEEEPDK